MAKRKRRKGQRSTKHYTQTTNNLAIRTALKPEMLRKTKQFLLHMWNPSCFSCNKSGAKSWMRKGLSCDYDKRRISVVICDTNTPYTFINPKSNCQYHLSTSVRNWQKGVGWYLRKYYLKGKMRRFFKDFWFNSLVLRIRWWCKKSEYKLQART